MTAAAQRLLQEGWKVLSARRHDRILRERQEILETRDAPILRRRCRVLGHGGGRNAGRRTECSKGRRAAAIRWVDGRVATALAFY